MPTMVQTDLNSLIFNFKIETFLLTYGYCAFLEGGAFRVTRNGQFVCKSQQHIHKSTVAYKPKKSFVQSPVDFHPITWARKGGERKLKGS